MEKQLYQSPLIETVDMGIKMTILDATNTPDPVDPIIDGPEPTPFE